MLYMQNMQNNMSVICSIICRTICRICKEICQINKRWAAVLYLDCSPTAFIHHSYLVLLLTRNTAPRQRWQTHDCGKVGTVELALSVLFILPAAVTARLSRRHVGHSNVSHSRAGQRPQTLEWYVRMLTPADRVTSRRSSWSASFRPPPSPPAHRSAAQAHFP